MESWVEKGWGRTQHGSELMLEYNRAFVGCGGSSVVELPRQFAEPYNAFHPENGPLWETSPTGQARRPLGLHFFAGGLALESSASTEPGIVGIGWPGSAISQS